MSNSGDRDNHYDSSERGMHGMTVTGGTVRVGINFHMVQDQIQVQ